MITALVCALSINAARADGVSGSLGVKHTSDYYFRGAQLSEDALQLNVGVGTNVAGLDVSVGYLTNQASGADNIDTLSLEIGKSVFDKTVSLAAGVYNMDGPDLTEGYVTASLNVLLTPTISVYRDTDDSLFSTEIGAGHTFDLGFADLTLSGLLGRTELTSSTDRDYTAFSARVSKSVGDITPHIQIMSVDSDSTSSETVVCLGVDFKF